MSEFYKIIFGNGMFNTVIMLSILLFSVLGLGVVIERAIYFRFNENSSLAKIKGEIKQNIERGEIKDAIMLLNSNRSSSAKVVKDILTFWYRTNTNNITALEEKAKESMLSQLPLLEKRMWLLSLAANVTPLLGLLGTVTGMIQAFQAVATHGTGDPSVLASGISTALYTTAGGLLVAIPAMAFYNYFDKKIDTTIGEMEKYSTEFINFFRK